MDDIDDIGLIEYDNWERLKPFTAKKGTTVGGTQYIPLEDNDQKPVFYDLQGESIYTNPPDTNMPSIDHGLDEDYIWNFPLSAFNQHVIKNPYSNDKWGASRSSNMPPWFSKLIAPSFFKEEKMKKLVWQYNKRLEFSMLQMRQALLENP